MLTRLKYVKILKIAVCLFIAATAILLLSNFVLAAAGPDVGLSYAAGTGLSATNDPRIIAVNIIRIALGFLGIIAVGLIIYAGWLWMTSEGNEDKIEQAKKILQNAVIGLIIILSAFAIVSFILNKLMGATDGSSDILPDDGQAKSYGLSALGNGIIESHYPARDQKEVPRNVSIIITFREPVLASTLCAPVVSMPDQPDKCAGGAINTDVVRIFQYSKEEEANCTKAYLSNPAKCVSLVKEVKVYSMADGKTFVFDPVNYLGSPSEYIDYSVYLGSGLKRQSGCEAGDLSKCEKAFLDEPDYGWSFEVSNKIDLTPPQVKPGEVAPAPDDLKDTVVSGVGAPATGTIAVISRPSIYRDARVQSIATGTDATVRASAEVNKGCQQDGDFSLAVASGPIASLYTVDAQDNTINLGQGTFGINSGGYKQAVFTECNLALTLLGAADNFAVGYLWNLTLNKATTADTVTVENITYVASSTESGNNFKVGDNNTTANSLRDAINNILSPNQDVSATVSDNVVTVTAKVAGAAGNSIVLSSSNKSALEIVAMKDGTDKADKVNNNCASGQTNCKTDQPMNSAIQINFNEAIMPLTVAGSSDELKDFIRVVNASSTAQSVGGACSIDASCKSFTCSRACIGDAVVNTDAGAKSKYEACSTNEQCKSNNCSAEADKRCVGDNEYLKGKFAVSNQYSTVDFLSDKECGVNNCGEKIYCLPANSHLKVELLAANLIPCGADDGSADDNKCQTYSPFNTCDSVRKFCRDNENNYYPQANLDTTKPNIIDGITDAAFNSLDGNRNDAAYGPASFYNENTPAATDGDNYKWSFYISDKLDLTPPKIKTTTPAIDGSAVDLVGAIKISFDKLMLSSRLTSGSIMIQNGKDRILHYLLNLRSFVDQPLGYWITNDGQQSIAGGVIDQTDVYINHTRFSGASTYKAQAGSGLKDIYQNCFLPCSSDSLTGTPSCCNGVATERESCL